MKNNKTPGNNEITKEDLKYEGKGKIKDPQLVSKGPNKRNA